MDLTQVSKMRKAVMVALTASTLLGGAVTVAALSFDMPLQDGAAAANATKEKVYKIGGDVTPPKLVHSVSAVYPDSERGKGKRSVTVLCKLVVTAQGLPEDVQVVQSPGKDFDDSAMEAIRQYRFTAACAGASLWRYRSSLKRTCAINHFS
jgi:TonB family protein